MKALKSDFENLSKVWVDFSEEMKDCIINGILNKI